MTNFIDLALIPQLLVQYFTGSYGVLAIAVTILFVLVLSGFGLDFRASLVFSLPVIAGLTAAGWIGVDWILYLVLIAVAFIYGAILLKLMGG